MCGRYLLGGQKALTSDIDTDRQNSMSLALAWGLIAGASLVIGGLMALYMTISRRTLGYIMAFGSGVLMSAIAYELVEQAVEMADGGGVAFGLFAGAITFFVGDLLIDRLGGSGR